MSRKPSDETELLRMAIQEALASATAPMSGAEVASCAPVANLGLDSHRVSHELSQLYKRRAKLFPLCRTYAAAGKATYEYYNPEVVKMELVPREERRTAPRREDDQAALNAVNPAPSEFQFDPVSFAAEPVPTSDANVSVPAGVRSITLTVGGVVVRIELN